MSDLLTFGPLFIATQLEDAAQKTLEEWMPTYNRRVERLLGKPIGWLQEPQSYEATSDQNHWPEEALPALSICCPGLLDRPIRDGEHNYRAYYELILYIEAAAGERRDTERLVKYYAAVLRELITQKGTLGGIAITSVWLDEKYNTKIKDDTQRSLGSAEVRFAVEVDEVVQSMSGPLTIPVEPDEVPADPFDVTGGKVNLIPEAL